MGSFSFTCSISGMPITYGTPVKWLILGTQEYNNLNCHVDSFYSPISIPISATYNDYGSIENYNKDSIGYIATSEILNSLSVEKNVGENECHDVEVKRGMSFDNWLNAIWEGRVFIDPRSREPFRVVQTMIREDVWNFLINYDDNIYSLKRANDYIKEICDPIVIIKKIPELERTDAETNLLTNNNLSSIFNYRSNLKLLFRHFNHSELLINHKDDLVCQLSQMLKVEWVMHALRKSWLAGNTIGDQFGEFEHQINFYKAMKNIAEIKKLKEDES